MTADYERLANQAELTSFDERSVGRRDLDGALRTLRVRMCAAIDRLAPRGSAYAREGDAALTTGSLYQQVSHLAPVVFAMLHDYSSGAMASIEQLLHAETFDSMLGQAYELHRNGYKDAAAVIAGSVLEEHLRSLCRRWQVETESSDGRPMRADKLNADLVKAGAYNTTRLKQVTSWLGLRNDAAHGHYDRYTAGQVELMLAGVEQFVQAVPA